MKTNFKNIKKIILMACVLAVTQISNATEGCNVYGCWETGGGCNVYGCWEAGGGCNVYGCWDGEPQNSVPTNPNNYECSISPSGSCYNVVKIGGKNVSDKCQSIDESIKLAKDLRSNGLCEASRNRCSIASNGNCYTGVFVGGVAVTDRCLKNTDAALRIVKQLRSIGLCQ